MSNYMSEGPLWFPHCILHVIFTPTMAMACVGLILEIKKLTLREGKQLTFPRSEGRRGAGLESELEFAGLVILGSFHFTLPPKKSTQALLQTWLLPGFPGNTGKAT